jgi:hypothetical protein
MGLRLVSRSLLSCLTSAFPASAFSSPRSGLRTDFVLESSLRPVVSVVLRVAALDVVSEGPSMLECAKLQSLTKMRIYSVLVVFVLCAPEPSSGFPRFVRPPMCQIVAIDQAAHLLFTSFSPLVPPCSTWLKTDMYPQCHGNITAVLDIQVLAAQPHPRLARSIFCSLCT